MRPEPSIDRLIAPSGNRRRLQSCDSPAIVQPAASETYLRRIEAGLRQAAGSDRSGRRTSRVGKLVIPFLDTLQTPAGSLRRPGRPSCAVVNAPHKALGRFAKNARRTAASVMQNLAPGRTLRLRADARQLHRLGVCQAHVAARVGQQHRMRRHRPAEVRVNRIAFDLRLDGRIPLGLMPASPNDPLARRPAGGGLADLLDKLVPVGRLGEVRIILDSPRPRKWPGLR